MPRNTPAPRTDLPAQTLNAIVERVRADGAVTVASLRLGRLAPSAEQALREAVERAGLDTELFAVLQRVGIESIWGLSFVSAVVSNVISNVPAVMLFTRVVPRLPDPTTAWLALAMSSTLAGNLTILGSIANLIVVEGARRHGIAISFVDYLRIGLPVTIATMAFGIWWLA